jgi:OFA family oxalate/formate antiporter-like MFS transporter
MAAGFGGGTALFIPFISSMIATRGYQAAFISTGIFQGLVIVVVAQFLRHPRVQVAAAEKAPVASASQLGRRPSTGSGRPEFAEGRQFSTLEMLKTPQFYMMYVAFVMMATGFLLATANLAPIAQSWGLGAAAVTLAATMSPIANGASRIFWGWASDRTGRENAMVIAFTLNAVSLILVMVLGQISGLWLALSLVLVYFTGGQIYSLFPSTTGDYFGTVNATSNYAVLYTAKGVAAFIGAWGGPLLFEKFGSWSVCFYGSAVMALIAAVLAMRLRSATAPRRAPVAVAAVAK